MATKAPVTHDVRHHLTVPEAWAWCPGCQRERRVIDGVLVPHRAWYGALAGMQACPGSLAPPGETSA